mmetsp:Transcript_5381/g.9036  ORF Transcript_5381/g.9036 Transcript_5381/m.9036 type:complete len:209 (-) Transcript_5381:11-637(-)
MVEQEARGHSESASDGEPGAVTIPQQKLNIKLGAGVSDSDIIALKSSIQSVVDTDSVSIFNFREITGLVNHNIGLVLLLLQGIVAFLFTLSFFQLLLSIQANLKENMWQFGVLRAIGMTKDHIELLTLIEAMGVIFSSIVLGFLVGWSMTLVSMSVIQIIQEMPVDYSVDWGTLGALFAMGALTVYVGTSLSVQLVNRKRISQILNNQ